jgi:hypothetical protein
MEQKIFLNASMEPKVAYELSQREFNALMDNLRLRGDIAKYAITLSNDRKTGKHPRLQPKKEEIVLLHEVLGDQNADDANIALTSLDILREDRSEVLRAVLHPSKSKLYKKAGRVALGLATMASAMNELRPYIIDNLDSLEQPELLKTMFDQFHAEGVERISSQV